jgi:hypothetical protein
VIAPRSPVLGSAARATVFARPVPS